MEIPFAEDGRFMGVVFELEKIPGRILEEEGMVLDSGSRETHSRLLKEWQPVRPRPIGQFLPLTFRQKHQAEMARINAFLCSLRLVHHMRDELMLCRLGLTFKSSPANTTLPPVEASVWASGSQT